MATRLGATLLAAGIVGKQMRQDEERRLGGGGRPQPLPGVIRRPGVGPAPIGGGNVVAGPPLKIARPLPTPVAPTPAPSRVDPLTGAAVYREDQVAPIALPPDQSSTLIEQRRSAIPTGWHDPYGNQVPVVGAIRVEPVGQRPTVTPINQPNTEPVVVGSEPLSATPLYEDYDTAADRARQEALLRPTYIDYRTQEQANYEQAELALSISQNLFYGQGALAEADLWNLMVLRNGGVEPSSEEYTAAVADMYARPAPTQNSLYLQEEQVGQLRTRVQQADAMVTALHGQTSNPDQGIMPTIFNIMDKPRQVAATQVGGWMHLVANGQAGRYDAEGGAMSAFSNWLGFGPGEMSAFATANAEAINQAYLYGYDADGDHVADFHGDRAVWEYFAGQQNVYQRIGYDLAMDPTNYFGVASGGGRIARGAAGALDEAGHPIIAGLIRGGVAAPLELPYNLTERPFDWLMEGAAREGGNLVRSTALGSRAADWLSSPTELARANADSAAMNRAAGTIYERPEIANANAAAGGTAATYVNPSPLRTPGQFWGGVRASNTLNQTGTTPGVTPAPGQPGPVAPYLSNVAPVTPAGVQPTTTPAGALTSGTTPGVTPAGVSPPPPPPAATTIRTIGDYRLVDNGPQPPGSVGRRYVIQVRDPNGNWIDGPPVAGYDLPGNAMRSFEDTVTGVAQAAGPTTPAGRAAQPPLTSGTTPPQLTTPATPNTPFPTPEEQYWQQVLERSLAQDRSGPGGVVATRVAADAAVELIVAGGQPLTVENIMGQARVTPLQAQEALSRYLKRTNPPPTVAPTPADPVLDFWGNVVNQPGAANPIAKPYQTGPVRAAEPVAPGTPPVTVPPSPQSVTPPPSGTMSPAAEAWQARIRGELPPETTPAPTTTPAVPEEEPWVPPPPSSRWQSPADIPYRQRGGPDPQTATDRLVGEGDDTIVITGSRRVGYELVDVADPSLAYGNASELGGPDGAVAKARDILWSEETKRRAPLPAERLGSAVDEGAQTTPGTPGVPEPGQPLGQPVTAGTTLEEPAWLRDAPELTEAKPTTGSYRAGETALRPETILGMIRGDNGQSWLDIWSKVTRPPLKQAERLRLAVFNNLWHSKETTAIRETLSTQSLAGTPNINPSSGAVGDRVAAWMTDPNLLTSASTPDELAAFSRYVEAVELHDRYHPMDALHNDAPGELGGPGGDLENAAVIRDKLATLGVEVPRLTPLQSPNTTPMAATHTGQGSRVPQPWEAAAAQATTPVDTTPVSPATPTVTTPAGPGVPSPTGLDPSGQYVGRIDSPSMRLRARGVNVTDQQAELLDRAAYDQKPGDFPGSPVPGGTEPWSPGDITTTPARQEPSPPDTTPAEGLMTMEEADEASMAGVRRREAQEYADLFGGDEGTTTPAGAPDANAPTAEAAAADDITPEDLAPPVIPFVQSVEDEVLATGSRQRVITLENGTQHRVTVSPDDRVRIESRSPDDRPDPSLPDGWQPIRDGFTRDQAEDYLRNNIRQNAAPNRIDLSGSNLLPEAAAAPETVTTPQGPQAVMPGVKLTEAPEFPNAPAQARQGAQAEPLRLDIQTDKTAAADANVQRFAGQQDLFSTTPGDPNDFVPFSEVADATGRTPVEGVFMMPMDQIHLNPKLFQPRKKTTNAIGLDRDWVNALVRNWKDVRQQPVVIWLDPRDGKYYVLSGHHRHAALEKMGRTQAKVEVFEGTQAEAVTFARESNAARPLTFTEIGDVAAARLAEGEDPSTAFAYTGMSENQVKQAYRISVLGDTAKELVDAGKVGREVAAIVGDQVADGTLSREASEMFFTKVLAKGKQTTRAGKKKITLTDMDGNTVIGRVKPKSKQADGTVTIILDDGTEIAGRRVETATREAAYTPYTAEEISQHFAGAKELATKKTSNALVEAPTLNIGDAGAQQQGMMGGLFEAEGQAFDDSWSRMFEATTQIYKQKQALEKERRAFNGVRKSTRTTDAQKAEMATIVAELEKDLEVLKQKAIVDPGVNSFMPNYKAAGQNTRLHMDRARPGYHTVEQIADDPSLFANRTVGEDLIAIVTQKFKTGETWWDYTEAQRLTHMAKGASFEEAVQSALKDWDQKLRLERGVGKQKGGDWGKLGRGVRLMMIDLPRDIILYNNVRAIARVLMQQVGNTFNLIADKKYIPALANLSPLQTAQAFTKREVMTPELRRLTEVNGWAKPLAESIPADQLTGSEALAPQRILEAIRMPQKPAAFFGNLIANRHVRDMANIQDNFARVHLATDLIKSDLGHAKVGIVDAGYKYASRNLRGLPTDAGVTIEQAINDLWKTNKYRGMAPDELRRAVTGALDREFGSSPRHFNAGVRLSRDWDNAQNRILLRARDENRRVLFAGPTTNADALIGNFLLFNFFFIRQTKFMARAMVANPGMARAVMAVAQSDLAEARREHAPPWLQNFLKVFDKYGVEMWANPAGLLGTYLFFRDTAETDEDASWLARQLGSGVGSALILPPGIEWLLNTAGYMGDAPVRDPFGAEVLNSFVKVVVNQTKGAGDAPGGGPWSGDWVQNRYRAIRSAFSGHAPGSERVPYVDAGATEDARFMATVAQVAREQGWSEDDIARDLASPNPTLIEEDNPVYEQAYDRYNRVDFIKLAARGVSPVPTAGYNSYWEDMKRVANGEMILLPGGEMVYTDEAVPPAIGADGEPIPASRDITSPVMAVPATDTETGEPVGTGETTLVINPGYNPYEDGIISAEDQRFLHAYKEEYGVWLGPEDFEEIERNQSNIDSQRDSIQAGSQTVAQLQYDLSIHDELGTAEGRYARDRWNAIRFGYVATPVVIEGTVYSPAALAELARDDEANGETLTAIADDWAESQGLTDALETQRTLEADFRDDHPAFDDYRLWQEDMRSVGGPEKWFEETGEFNPSAAAYLDEQRRLTSESGDMQAAQLATRDLAQAQAMVARATNAEDRAVARDLVNDAQRRLTAAQGGAGAAAALTESLQGTMAYYAVLGDRRTIYDEERPPANDSGAGRIVSGPGGTLSAAGTTGGTRGRADSGGGGAGGGGGGGDEPNYGNRIVNDLADYERDMQLVTAALGGTSLDSLFGYYRTAAEYELTMRGIQVPTLSAETQAYLAWATNQPAAANATPAEFDQQQTEAMQPYQDYWAAGGPFEHQTFGGGSQLFGGNPYGVEGAVVRGPTDNQAFRQLWQGDGNNGGGQGSPVGYGNNGADQVSVDDLIGAIFGR